jgi:hypothetical protein
MDDMKKVADILAPPEPNDGPRKQTKMTTSQWAEAEALWMTGEVELSDLSKRFGGIRIETLSRHFKAAGIKKGSAAPAEAIKKKVVEAAVSPDSLAGKIKETREQNYAWTKALSSMTMALLLKSKQAGATPASVFEDMRAIDLAQRIISAGWKTRSEILKIDKEDAMVDELPNLVVRGLTLDEIETIRNKGAMEDPESEELKGLEGILDDEELEVTGGE